MLANASGVRAKIRRAEKHLRELENALDAYFAENPYGLGARGDNRTGISTFYITQVADIPDDIRVIIGDVVHNLRSALDHLAWQLVISAGNRPTGKTAFPICSEQKDFLKKGIEKMRGMRQAAQDAIAVLQPYTGNDPNNNLLQLHKLSNVDKHRVVLTAGPRFFGHTLTPSQRKDITDRFYGSYPKDHPAPMLKGVFIPPTKPAIFPLQAGAELVTLPISEVAKDLQFHFQIGFDEPGIIQGEAVDAALHRMLALVRAIVDDFTSNHFN